jgi:AhpD family alkylhydroperoxidase
VFVAERLNYDQVVPEAMKGFRAVHAAVAASALPADLLALVYLRVSQINGCSYCVDMHTHEALRAGVDPTKLALVVVWRESPDWFTPAEGAALAWAESVTHVSETHAPDALWAELREHFDESSAGHLTVAISLMNALNRVAVSFRRGPAHRPRH